MKISLSAVMAMVAASAAMAGDYGATSVEPAIAPPAAAHAFQGGDWTGVYVGLQASAVDGTNSVVGGADAFDFGGGLFGVHLGYNHDFGRIVLGGELEYDQGNVGSEFRPAFGTGDAGVDLDWIARVKLRAGYDLGRTMVYATGGATRASASTSPGFPGTDPGKMDGHFLGAGIDYLVTEHFVAGVEVLSHRFGDFENSTLTDTETELTSISLRLGYRF